MQYILIADDNPDITDVLSEYAKKEGYEALLAADGEEALRLLPNYIRGVLRLQDISQFFQICC